MEAWQERLRVKGWSSEYPSVDRFLRHYERKVRSEQTRRNSLFALSQLCRFSGKSPEELVSLSSKVVGESVQAFLDAKRGEDRSIRYINVISAYLGTFFKVNGFKDGLEVERYHQPARYRKRPEYIPTSEEIRAMAYAAGSERNTALILAAYESGLRNATLRALRYGDVRDELERGYEIVKLPVYLEMKRVDPGACKGGVPYYTFISCEAVEALRGYLLNRGRAGDGEPLFCSETTNIPEERRRTIRVKGDTLEAVVKRAARKAGLREWRDVTPHCLRKAFESALRNSGIDTDDREFLMGHVLSGSKDAYYDRSKVEELRSKYSNVRFFTTAELKRVDMIKAFARTLGVENIEIRIAKLRETEPQIVEEDAIGRIVREELMKPFEIRARKARTGSKKVIDEGELEGYLAEGWDVQAVLPSGRVLIRRRAT